MKVGDLVRWYNKYADAMWYGVITKKSSSYKFYVEWVCGKQGWAYVGNLEVVCK